MDNRVVLNDELRDKLAGEARSAELYDRDGRIVGYFVSPEEYTRLVYAWAKAEFAKDDIENPIDDDDELGSMTTAELLAYLESLNPTQSGAA